MGSSEGIPGKKKFGRIPVEISGGITAGIREILGGPELLTGIPRFLPELLLRFFRIFYKHSPMNFLLELPQEFLLKFKVSHIKLHPGKHALGYKSDPERKLSINNCECTPGTLN